jgi:hypothetical protein
MHEFAPQAFDMNLTLQGILLLLIGTGVVTFCCLRTLIK